MWLLWYTSIFTQINRIKSIFAVKFFWSVCHFLPDSCSTEILVWWNTFSKFSQDTIFFHFLTWWTFRGKVWIEYPIIIYLFSPARNDCYYSFYFFIIPLLLCSIERRFTLLLVTRLSWLSNINSKDRWLFTLLRKAVIVVRVKLNTHW
jgi:hypothetical protein